MENQIFSKLDSIHDSINALGSLENTIENHIPWESQKPIIHASLNDFSNLISSFNSLFQNNSSKLSNALNSCNLDIQKLNSALNSKIKNISINELTKNNTNNNQLHEKKSPKPIHEFHDLKLDLKQYDDIGFIPIINSPQRSNFNIIGNSRPQCGIDFRGSMSRRATNKSSRASLKEMNDAYAKITIMNSIGSIRVPAACVPPPPLENGNSSTRSTRSFRKKSIDISKSNTFVPPSQPQYANFISNSKSIDSNHLNIKMADSFPLPAPSMIVSEKSIPQPAATSAAGSLKTNSKSTNVSINKPTATSVKSNYIPPPPPAPPMIVSIPQPEATSAAGSLKTNSIPPPPPSHHTEESIKSNYTPIPKNQTVNENSNINSNSKSISNSFQQELLSKKLKPREIHETEFVVKSETIEISFQQEILSKKLKHVNLNNDTARSNIVPKTNPEICFDSQLRAKLLQRGKISENGNQPCIQFENSDCNNQKKLNCVNQVKLHEQVLETKILGNVDSHIENCHSKDQDTESISSEKLPILEVTPDMIATVTFDFAGNGPGQIGFKKDEKLIIIDWNYSDGWANISSLDGKNVGIFPQAFIKRN